MHDDDATQPTDAQDGSATSSPPAADAGAVWGARSAASRARPAAGEAIARVRTTADVITERLGIDAVEEFSVKGFFSEVFSRHDPDDVETQFTVGSPVTTPQLHPNMATLPSPWLFFRVLVGAVVVYLMFLTGWTEFGNPNLIPGMIIVGSFAVPGAVLVLFFELNTPKNVSIVRVIQFALVGGTLSLLLSLILFELTPFLGILGASAAGIVEEIGKLAALIVALRFVRIERYPYLLNAMLLGAAVGTGFAAFESAGYALVFSLMDPSSIGTVITTRGVLSPFAHIVWTAIAAAAYWQASKEHHTLMAALTSRSFLVLFSVPVVLHFVWNLPFEGPLLLKYWVLGFAAWVVVISLIQSGLREVGEVAASDEGALR